MFDFPNSPTLGQTYTPSGGPTYVWNNTAWVVLSPGSSYSTTIFTATAGQTTFSTTYVVGAIYVYRNGVLLAPADFTATNGTSVVLANACTAGDTVEVINLAQVPYVNCVQKTGDTMTGNLNFSGNGLRITGDFSNATVANRLMVQTTTANSATSFNVIPSGTQTSSNIRAVNNSDPTNAAFTATAITFTESQFVSGIYGAGTYLPMTFYTGGSERVRIDTSGNVGIGLTSLSSSYASSASLNILNTGNINWPNSSGTWNTTTAGAAITYYNNNQLYFDAKDSNGQINFRVNGANTRMSIGNSGDITGYANLFLAGQSTGEQYMRIGSGRTGNGYSYIDLQGDATYSNGMRLIRTNSGANAMSSIEHRGTGPLQMVTQEAAPILFYTSGGNERARITPAGELLIGTTTALPGYGNSATGSEFFADGTACHSKTGNITMTVGNNTSSNQLIWFGYQGSNTGQVVLNGTTGVLFQSASDYRLKENIVPLSGALARVSALKPSKFNFKSDPTRVVDGFIAHEVQEIVPDAVSGEKDGKEMQGVDYGRLTPLLTAAIQELKAKLDAAEARIAKLEGAA